MNRPPVDHAKIIELARQGLSRRKIAAIVGCHFNTVHYVLNPAAYERHLDDNILRRRAKRGEPNADA